MNNVPILMIFLFELFDYLSWLFLTPNALESILGRKHLIRINFRDEFWELVGKQNWLMN